MIRFIILILLNNLVFSWSLFITSEYKSNMFHASMWVFFRVDAGQLPNVDIFSDSDAVPTLTTYTGCMAIIHLYEYRVYMRHLPNKDIRSFVLFVCLWSDANNTISTLEARSPNHSSLSVSNDIGMLNKRPATYGKR